MIGELYLRARATSVGPRPRVIGVPFLQRGGPITIGSDFTLACAPVRSHLVTGPGAVLAIGDRVSIGSGAAIAADTRVTIGSDVRMGRKVMILDSDFHDTAAFLARGASAPVEIADGVTLGDGVVVLKGSRIGRGARVLPNSVVSGAIVADAVVGGVPARKVRAPGAPKGIAFGDPEEVLERVKAVVSETFHVTRALEPGDGPAQIPTWDSLGNLRLALALEDEFHVPLADDALYGVKSVGDVACAVSARLARAREGAAI